MENSKQLKVLENLVDCTTFSRLHSTYSPLGTLLNAISNLKRFFITVVQCYEAGIFPPRSWYLKA